MTVKELQEANPNSVIFVWGFGVAYPSRRYPQEFSRGERLKLNKMEVSSIRRYSLFDGIIEARVEEVKK